jgi:hypothetical protein
MLIDIHAHWTDDHLDGPPVRYELEPISAELARRSAMLYLQTNASSGITR